MATTTHGLAILTNSCVKPPIDPKTGLSTSFHDRLRDSYQHYDEECAEEYIENEELGIQEYPSSHVFSAPATDTISRELSNVNDEEFYEKLLQLKNEHKKTLAICEKLYKRKLNREHGGSRTNGFVGTVPTPSVHREQDLVPNGVHDFTDDEVIDVRVSMRESHTKPPTGRPPMSPDARASIAASKVLTTVPRPRPSSAPTFKPGALTRSLDEEVWQKIIAERRKAAETKAEEQVDDEIADVNTSKERWEMTQSETYDNPELTTALSRIEDMWENFSVENYAPRSRERPSSASVTRQEKEKKVKEWRHRITIPKPFKMTIREDNKEKKESKILKECQEVYLQKQKEEEMECEKKFKASPAPAHIYLPMYDEIMEKNEARRRYVKQYSMDLLKSQEAPFSFLKREESKKQHKRRNSAPQIEVRNSQTFRANPAPSHLYDSSVEDKIKEEEEYRKIRIKMRSKELLKSANLPPSMEARKQLEEERRRDRSIKSKKKNSYKPKVNHEVPDYDELYRHFQKELARRKREREATVVKPFALQSTHTHCSQDKILRDMKKDEETLRENRWPFKNSRLPPRKSLGVMSSSLDSIPAKMTVSADLRSSQTKKRIDATTQREMDEMEADRKRRIRDMRLRKSIQERTSNSDTSRSLDKTYEQKVRNMRESDRVRMEEYKSQLNEMKERVKKRPLLFEQESQTNAKVAAQKKFTATLKSHGIDEDFIQSHSSRTASLYTDEDNYEDEDFEESHPKDEGGHTLSASEEEEIAEET